MAFKPFRHKSNGAVYYYPEHFIDDPILGADLEEYDPEVEIFEEDKVDLEDHNLPVEQRGRVVATPYDEYTVPELQGKAKDRDLSTSGNKADLIERLAENDKESE